MHDRGDIEAETLLKVVLVLVIVWIAVEILGLVTDVLEWLLDLFMPIFGLVIVVLIVLWLLDRL